MKSKNIIIAIDGPAGSGKSTVAKIVAKRFNFNYLDSGALYRTVALKALKNKINLEDEDALCLMLSATKIEFDNADKGVKVKLDGIDVSKEIRGSSVSKGSSIVAKHPKVRSKVGVIQRDFASHGNVVCEGRDMGAEVFPDAQIKFYLDASVSERIKRRYKELLDLGKKVEFDKLKKDIKQRDKRDSSRAVSPLRKARDAIVVDTSDLNIKEVAGVLINKIKEKIKTL